MPPLTKKYVLPSGALALFQPGGSGASAGGAVVGIGDEGSADAALVVGSAACEGEGESGFATGAGLGTFTSLLLLAAGKTSCSGAGAGAVGVVPTGLQRPASQAAW